MRLFVGNLSFQTTEDDLRDAFGQHGSITDVKIMTDRMTGRSRGFGFVTFSTQSEGETAIRALDSPRPAYWNAAAVLACAAGMACKETMVVAPALVVFQPGALAARDGQRRQLGGALHLRAGVPHVAQAALLPIRIAAG